MIKETFFDVSKTNWMSRDKKITLFKVVENQYEPGRFYFFTITLFLNKISY